MNETRIYADDFNKTFAQEGDFLSFLESREDNSFWKRAKIKALRLFALNEDGKVTEQIKEKFARNGEEGLLTDTMENTRLLLKLEDEYYPVRSCAIKTILERAGISGPRLSKLSKDVYARILNDCLKISKGDALIRLAEGKISAAHAGDSNDYAVLNMEKIFRHTVQYLQERFPGCTFIGASFDHSIVTAMWELTSNDELLNAYKDEIVNRGLSISVKEIKPLLRVTSSDVGISGANLFPMLCIDDKQVSLGSPLKLEHKSGVTLSHFEDQLAMIYSRYKEAVTNIIKLMDIEIYNPKNCMLGVMKRIGITKKYSYQAAELFIAQHGEDACTAHDLYYRNKKRSYNQINGGKNTAFYQKLKNELLISHIMVYQK